MSGHGFLVGANSNKILMRVCYSKSCCTCRRQNKKRKRMEKKWRQKRKLQEYKKQMIKTTVVRTISMVHQVNGSNWCCRLHHALFDTKKAKCKYLVGDNDSSTQANCWHSFQDKIDAGIWANKTTCWPKKNGSYLKDYGKLPLYVPEIKGFLTNPMHCHKCFGKDLFKLVKERGKELAFDKIDCAHLK